MRHAAAIIGAGFMGKTHAEALRRIGVPIAGVLGSRPERAAESARSLKLNKGYETLQDLLADPLVSVVHITSPNRAHFEQATACLKAGKHVLCEKPLAMNRQESDALVRLAHDRGLLAGVNYNIRYYPLCHEARSRVANGDLGAVFHINGSYSQDWLLFPTDFNWRVLSSEAGPLRAIADIGTHWIDLAHFISGLEVEAVCADLRTVHAERRRPAGPVETFQCVATSTTIPCAIDTEDYGAVLIRFRGGARGSLWVSQVTAGRKNALKIEIACEHGSLAFETESPDQLWLGRREQANQIFPRDPALLSTVAREHCGYPGGHVEGYADTFKACFAEFHQAVELGSPLPSNFPSFGDGHREMVVCEAISRSHLQGRWVHIEELP